MKRVVVGGGWVRGERAVKTCVIFEACCDVVVIETKMVLYCVERVGLVVGRVVGWLVEGGVERHAGRCFCVLNVRSLWDFRNFL